MKINVIYGTKIVSEIKWNLIELDGLHFAYKIGDCVYDDYNSLELSIKVKDNDYFFIAQTTFNKDKTVENVIQEKFKKEVLGDKNIEEYLYESLKQNFNDEYLQSLYYLQGLIQYFNVNEENHPLYNDFISCKQRISNMKEEKQRIDLEKEEKRKENEKRRQQEDLEEALSLLKDSKPIDEDQVIILAKYFDVWKSIPIKTRGFINNKLISLHDNGVVRAYGSLSENSRVRKLYRELQEYVELN